MSSILIEHKDDSLFERLDGYNWDGDAEYRGGLQAILGSSSTPERARELELRARCFYFSRKFNIEVDYDAYKHWLNSRPLPLADNRCNPAQGQIPLQVSSSSDSIITPALSDSSPAPYPISFEHIVELITNGKDVPGIKEIPTTVLEGQESPSNAAIRKKPWEK